MICLKIRTFVVSATTECKIGTDGGGLWFAWKFVPLWYQQQPNWFSNTFNCCCDLLENSYLCGISNNQMDYNFVDVVVVICLKIRTFVVSATTVELTRRQTRSCDLLENSYLCGISNNSDEDNSSVSIVVICLKIRTFVVSATTHPRLTYHRAKLWFAWKFVPLWYQQQHHLTLTSEERVVICLKIRTFVVSATTASN